MLYGRQIRFHKKKLQMGAGRCMAFRPKFTGIGPPRGSSVIEMFTATPENYRFCSLRHFKFELILISNYTKLKITHRIPRLAWTDRRELLLSSVEKNFKQQREFWNIIFIFILKNLKKLLNKFFSLIN